MIIKSLKAYIRGLKIKMKKLPNNKRNYYDIMGNRVGNTIVCEYWHKSDSINLGDELSKYIFQWMIDHLKLKINANLRSPKHVLAIGSLLGLGDFDATVWGTGIHRYSQIISLKEKAEYKKYDIRAVRGPITRTLLLEAGYQCPEIYGDPAILLPKILDCECDKEYDISVICHILRKNEDNDLNLHFINIQSNNFALFVEEIKKSKKIISSSLHGIILAESYGIPAVFWNDNMDQEILKYYDWYYSTGRTNFAIGNTLAECVLLEPSELPELENMRQKLVETFPVDIFDDLQ